MAVADTLKSTFSKSLEALKTLGKKKEESVVGIDIGTSAIKIVQLREERDRAILETYGALALAPFAEKEIGDTVSLPADKTVEALNRLMKEAGVSTGRGHLAIPATAGLVFLVELPPQVKKSEFPSVISNEARKYIPVPISEVSLDWFVVPKKEELYEGEAPPLPSASPPQRGGEEEGKIPGAPTEVLVVAIPNNTLSKYNQIVKDSDLESGTFEHEVFSSIRSNLIRELAPVLLFDFGASRTKLSIVERGIVKNFHSINRGSAHITHSLSRSLEISFSQAEAIKKEKGLSAPENEAGIIRKSLNYIFSEANSVVLSYEKKYNKIISKVILTGGGSALNGFSELAQENFRAPVSVGDPFGKTESPAFLEETLKKIGPEFAVAVGLALGKL